MKKKLKGLFEIFAKAMVQPLMFLSCAGMIMVVGVLIINTNVQKLLPFLSAAPIQLVGNLIYQGVMVLINNLGVLFVIGIPAALAKGDKHRAGIIGFMSYLIYLTTSNQLLSATGKLAEANPFLGLYGTGQATILGIQCVDMGVFGGIILGCLVGYVFNRTYKKRFKGALQIYSGANWSFFVMFFISLLFAAVSNVVWPWVQAGIGALANVIKNTGTFGLFLYGFLERILIPTGLHHLVYTPFQFSALGGTLTMGETTVNGAYAIYAMEAAIPQVTKFSDSIYYMATGFTKMWGYIGIGLSFIFTAKPENKKKTVATIVPLIVTACIGGITEPLDFMFIFAAPVLFVLNAVIAGTFIALMKIFGVTSFCGGNLLAGLLSNIAQGVEKTNWPMMVVLGLVQIVLYFVLFSFLIKKLDLKTPGREDEVAAPEGEAPAVAAPAAPGEADPMALTIIKALGGKANINTVENCITRLRVNMADPSLVDEALINTTKPKGIVRKDNDIQIIYGLEVADIRRAVDEALEKTGSAT